MKKQLILTILLFLAVLTSVFSLEGTALYESALENFKQKQNEIALEQLLEFRNLNSEHRKADDALWYIGRLYEKLDKISEAESAFRGVLTIPGSNRLAEAAYDLSQILYSNKQYTEITKLLSRLTGLEKPDSYEIRSLEILGDSFYNLGRASRSNYRDEEASEYFISAAEVYEFRLNFLENEVDRSNTYYSLGKAYRRLATLELNRSYYNEYYTKSVEALKKSDLPRAFALLEDLKSDRKANLQIDIIALGGVDNITAASGFDFGADITATLPLGFNKNLTAGLNYTHNDFSFKTFNFDSSKTGDLRLIQSTDKISSDISLEIGSSRRFLSTLRLDGDYRWAEDFGDNYYALQISEDLLWSINSQWETGIDSEFGWKVYPDYLINGHQIDSVQGGASPYVQWYFMDNSDLTLTYDFNLKQYLEAKHDTSNPAIDSTKDRQYLTNSIELEIDSKLNSIIDTSLLYEFSILESNNYDERITDSGATVKYMEDYYDYLQHKIKGSADFEWSDRFRTNFDGSLELRNFTNYIAQDAAGVFITGDEKRSDLAFSFDTEIGLVVWSNQAGAEAELIGQLWFEKSISNMEDEGSFATNYDFWGGLFGVEIRLP